jgi:hypothetical protein
MVVIVSIRPLPATLTVFGRSIIVVFYVIAIWAVVPIPTVVSLFAISVARVLIALLWRWIVPIANRSRATMVIVMARRYTSTQAILFVLVEWPSVVFLEVSTLSLKRNTTLWGRQLHHYALVHDPRRRCVVISTTAKH